LKLNKNSLKVNIWKYLILFSVCILAFLWLFQVIFLSSYYELVKKNDMKKTVNHIINSYQGQSFEESLDNLSYDKSVCIEVFVENTLVYSSNMFNRGCLIEGESNLYRLRYREDFVNSNVDKKMYEIINPKYNNKTLVYGIKLSNNVYAFVNTSLDPIDSTIVILKNQLIWVTIIVLGLSFVIAYFISKKISHPIEKINKSAKKMADGDYETKFEADTKIEEISGLATTLNYARDELAKTDELRRELLANVSHDLKTPLTMIKAYAEMTRDLNGANKTKRENNLNVIIEEADRLNLLVNDILDLSSIKSGTEDLILEKIDLTSLISPILNRYQILIEKDNYNFIFNQKESIFIFADKKKLEQVIYNLINNAINYTGDDLKVTINIIETKNNVRVEISDTGKGIKKEDLSLIWDKYYKIDKNHKRNVYGTGLGLSIVKNILVAHNFPYGVISKRNKGTTFWFEIKK